MSGDDDLGGASHVRALAVRVGVFAEQLGAVKDDLRGLGKQIHELIEGGADRSYKIDTLRENLAKLNVGFDALKRDMPTEIEFKTIVEMMREWSARQGIKKAVKTYFGYILSAIIAIWAAHDQIAHVIAWVLR